MENVAKIEKSWQKYILLLLFIFNEVNFIQTKFALKNEKRSILQIRSRLYSISEDPK